MKVCVLASGSKGNSTYIETENVLTIIMVFDIILYYEEYFKNL